MTCKQNAKGKPAVVATRKSCAASGAGLSHYILMDRRPKARKP